MARISYRILVVILLIQMSCVIYLNFINESFLPACCTNFPDLVAIKDLEEDYFKAEKHSIKKPLIILIWARFWMWKEPEVLGFIEQGMQSQPGCFCTIPENRVIITFDRSLYDQATAVVFHPRNLHLSDLPRHRRPDQLWVAFEKEAYGRGWHRRKDFVNWRQFNGIFNWTMNFRRDSDVWAPYGTFLPNEKIIPVEDIKIKGVSLDEWISGKDSSKLMASVISHCKSQSAREMILEELQRFSVSISTFGKCGDIQICRRLNKECNHTEFWTDLARQYKFYFAAENTLCEDYITEKLWRTLDVGMVPVVYGAADYKALAPPNSFINLRDFKSSKHLMEYLHKLNNDDEQYKQYFFWRSEYYIRMDDCWAGFCSLCEKVADFRMEKWTPEKSKLYDNIDLHWRRIKGRGDRPDRPSCVIPRLPHAKNLHQPRQFGI